ncbi:hypothetical protein [Steroidobacter denitrificans]|nr:hypothetical protein [Steroidobacter denitrificans]
MRAIVLAGLVMVGTGQAQQTSSDTIFGLELNAPITLSECEKTKILGDYVYRSIVHDGMCYERSYKFKKTKRMYREGPLVDEQIVVKFAHKNRPPIGNGYSFTAILKGGNLISVFTRTDGIGSQTQDLALLDQKFGTPTRLERLSLQNGAGAKFEGLIAEWELPSGTYVRLASPDLTLASRPNVGSLSVMTADARAEQIGKEKAADAERTKL